MPTALEFTASTCPSVLQLEESEFTCAAAVKARKSMEAEIEDLHVQMDDISKAKSAVSVTACPWHRPSSPSRGNFPSESPLSLTPTGSCEELRDDNYLVASHQIRAPPQLSNSSPTSFCWGGGGLGLDIDCHGTISAHNDMF